MSFHFSKSKFVSACTRCNKYAWLDKYMPEQKAAVSEFTQSLFDNGHKVGALAQKYLHADIDVTAYTEDGSLDLGAMIRETAKHMRAGTPAIAEASFSFDGFFCSVDVLLRNTDGSYDLCEVKSSKQEKSTKKNPSGVPEKYILDSAYQRYVLEHCGVNVRKVYVVMLSRDYIRGRDFNLNEYFVRRDVTVATAAKQVYIATKLAELEPILDNSNEPLSVLCDHCNGCDYFDYCSRHVSSPSPFDVYGLKFSDKCAYYRDGVPFEAIPYVHPNLAEVARLQIAYHDRPQDAHIDKRIIQSFLNSLTYPLYSLDFETYQAVVPEFEGMKTYEQIPFQYSLHKVPAPDADLADIEERHFLELSGADPRRAIAERLVQDIPYGACVVAYHRSTEQGIIGRLAAQFSDLADHLLSFTYRDPRDVFSQGGYYVAAMGKSLSLKSVAPALYPHDAAMDYHNLEGAIKNGTQAMNAIGKAGELSESEREQLRRDLENYCALDTMAVVKILNKLYEVSG